MDSDDTKDHKLFTNEFSEYFVVVCRRGKEYISDKRKELTAEHEYSLDKNSFVPHTYLLKEQFVFNGVK